MIPGRYAPQLYAVMRIVFGSSFLCHGLMKFGMFGGTAAAIGSWPFGIAGPLEVIIGVLVVLGLLTRPAALVGSGEMAVAFFMAHVPRGSLVPVVNGGEPAVLFCFAFLYMSARGSGIWSVDAARAHR
jgi:putative oxidoreductase